MADNVTKRVYTCSLLFFAPLHRRRRPLQRMLCIFYYTIQMIESTVILIQINK